MIIALLKQILLNANPVAATDPQSLLSQAACYDCYGGGGMWTLMILALLKQIAEGGGSGPGTVCIVGGVGAPVGAPPCNFSVYIQQPGPNFGLWLGDVPTGWSNVLGQGP